MDTKTITNDIDKMLLSKGVLSEEYKNLKRCYRSEEERFFILNDLSEHLEKIYLEEFINETTIYVLDGEWEFNYIYGEQDIFSEADHPHVFYEAWKKRRLEEAKELLKLVKNELPSSKEDAIDFENDADANTIYEKLELMKRLGLIKALMDEKEISDNKVAYIISKIIGAQLTSVQPVLRLVLERSNEISESRKKKVDIKISKILKKFQD
jgi:hypothetical protein